MIENLFQAACDVAPEQRSIFLAQADCNTDVRREVEALLASSQVTLGLLTKPVNDAIRELGVGSPADQRFGSYV
jgi:hypothetical protein